MVVGKLPWREIKKEVVAAVQEMQPGHGYLKHRKLAEYIEEHRPRFPNMGDTRMKIMLRIQTAVEEMHWSLYTSKGAASLVSIVPEDVKNGVPFPRCKCSRSTKSKAKAC